MSNKKISCVDLFAGAGGFSLAAKNAGLSVVAAIEKNSNACITYRRNIIKRSQTRLYEKDILELSPKDLLRAHFAESNGCDVVLGGPPCQGFSVHRINDAGVGDARNVLILRYFEYVAKLRPKVFLMENVPGILWQRHKDFLGAFYEQGKATGYEVRSPVILDARDYGVPQRRKRVFILGVRKDFSFSAPWPPAPTHGCHKARKDNPSLQPWITAASVFSQPLPENDPNNIHMNHSSDLIEVFKSTPLNGGSRRDSNRVLPCHEEHSGHKDVYGRIDPSQPGPTMTTACINPSKGRFVHPTEHHGITVRQAARFQTFPDWFVFQGGLISSGEQIGNAVPVQLGEILLRTLAKGIKHGLKHRNPRKLKGRNRG
jgi:DNA (cytosine-5)-methyltransferase 1